MGIMVGCVVCLQRSGERVEAVTVVNGYAACADHLDLVSAPGFDVWKLRKEGRGRGKPA